MHAEHTFAEQIKALGLDHPHPPERVPGGGGVSRLRLGKGSLNKRNPIARGGPTGNAFK